MSTVGQRGAESLKRLRTRADDAVSRLEQAREVVPAVDAAFVARSRDLTAGGSLMAAAIAYRLFVWLLPFSLVLASLLGFLHAAGEGSPAEVANDVGLSAYVVATVDQAAEQADRSRWLMLAVGTWALYSASFSGAKTVAFVSGRIWGVPVGRPTKKARTAAAFTGCVLATMVVSVAAQFARREAPGLGLAVTLAVVVAYAVVATVGLSLLPHADVPWTHLIPGAVFAACATQLLYLVTVFYLADKITSSSELYGGLGAAAAILLWLYLVGRVIVGATAVNATLWERRTGQGEADRLPGQGAGGAGGAKVPPAQIGDGTPNAGLDLPQSGERTRNGSA